MNNGALFLDRDGVINHMILYKNGWDSPQKPEDVKLILGIGKIISWANRNKISVVEVSNQPGVAKGKMDEKIAGAIEHRVHKLLKKNGSVIDKVYVCPHHPEAVIKKYKIICDCRKPKPGLLLKAAKENNIDLKKGIFLGDKASDAIAGDRAGIKTIIYLHNEDEDQKILDSKNSKSDYKVTSIVEASKIIKNFFRLT